MAALENVEFQNVVESGVSHPCDAPCKVKLDMKELLLAISPLNRVGVLYENPQNVLTR